MSTEAATVVPPRKATSLYELVERMRLVLALVDERDGEIDDATGAELDALAASLDERVEAIAAVYRSLREESEACKRMAQPYLDRAKRKAQQAETLRLRLFAAMQECGRSKIETPTATASIQKSAPSVELLVPEHEAPAKLPARFLETRTTVLKDKLKSALQGGEAFDFARLVQGSHLRIR